MAAINKTLILSLIKDDLIHYKLISGLNALKLNAIDYSLSISDTIFKLMRIKDNQAGETLFEYYLKLRNEVVFMDFGHSHENVEELAIVIYNEILKKKAHLKY